ncbi:hypothetical protein A0E43_04625 [Pectobacterium cacticida]
MTVGNHKPGSYAFALLLALRLNMNLSSCNSTIFTLQNKKTEHMVGLFIKTVKYLIRYVI